MLPGGQQGQQSSQSSSGNPGGGQQQMQQMRSDQQAVKQGLEQLGKNLQEAGERSAMVNREVGAALARANLSAEQTVKAMEQANAENMPSQQAQETLDALNKLAAAFAAKRQFTADAARQLLTPLTVLSFRGSPWPSWPRQSPKCVPGPGPFRHTVFSRGAWPCQPELCQSAPARRRAARTRALPPQRDLRFRQP